METLRNYGRQNNRGEYRNNSYRNDSYGRSRNRSREKGHFPEIMTTIEPGVPAIVDQSQDLEQVQPGIE